MHFINSRFAQLESLSSIHESHRPGEFVKRMLIPTGSNLIKLDHALENEPELQAKVQKKRKFVDDLRSTLDNLAGNYSADVPRAAIPGKNRTVVARSNVRRISSKNL